MTLGRETTIRTRAHEREKRRRRRPHVHFLRPEVFVSFVACVIHTSGKTGCSLELLSQCRPQVLELLSQLLHLSVECVAQLAELLFVCVHTATTSDSHTWKRTGRTRCTGNLQCEYKNVCNGNNVTIFVHLRRRSTARRTVLYDETWSSSLPLQSCKSRLRFCTLARSCVRDS